MIDFRNKDTIVERFNNAVEQLNLALKAKDLKDTSKEIDCRRNASSGLYQVLEWSIKHHLDKRNISLTPSHYGKNMLDTLDLINLLKNYGEPKLNDPKVKINSNLLIRLKGSLRNQYEHEGKVPSLEGLLCIVEEIAKIIYTYVENKAHLKLVNTNFVSNIPKWNEFFIACDEFNDNEIYYVLVTGPMQEIPNDQLSLLSKLPWRLVFDFDPDSKKNGFAFHRHQDSTMVSPYELNKDTIFKKPINVNQKRPYWFYANGLTELDETVYYKFRYWKNNYDDALESLIKRVSKSFTEPIKVVITYDSPEYVERICEKFEKCFGNRVEFIFALPSINNMRTLIEDYEEISTFVPVTISEIAHGLRMSKPTYFESDNGIEILLPQKDHQTVHLDQDTLYNLEQYFEVVHLNIASETVDQDKRIDYYRGQTITWQGLKYHDDIPRWNTKKLQRTLEQNLFSGNNAIFVLSHRPGLGGTTIGKRLAWEIHDEHPTLILKDYQEIHTADKIEQIYDLTKKTVFVVAETSQISLEKIESLFHEVKSRTRPAVFLVIKRGTKSTIADSSLYKLDRLTGDEPKDFKNHYLKLLNEETSYPDIKKVQKEKAILDIYSKKSNIDEMNPFSLGLLVFEREFLGLKPYINQFTKLIKSEEQKKILIYLALAYRYAGKGLPTGFFFNLINNNKGDVDKTQLLDLLDYLPDGIDSIIVKEKEANGIVSLWRPRHYLIADELKNQLMSGRSDITHWAENLAHYAMNLIKDSKIGGTGQSSYILDVLRDIFIKRFNEDIKDDHFSALISDVPYPEAKEQILKTLVEEYPDEPHFQAHLARYYSFIDKNPKKAIHHIELAIELSEVAGNKDPLLFHIKGMCIRSEVYSHIETMHQKYKTKEMKPTKDDISHLKYLADNAETQFEIVRNINHDPYGYVANIQMLIRLVDFGYQVSGLERSEFLKRNLNTWYGDCIDKAEGLLEDIKRIKVYEEDPYISSTEKDLVERFYADYRLVLQHWDNILRITDDKGRARRGIVRTYARKFKDYSLMDENTINRILKLMDQNILDEPDNEKNIYLWFQAARYNKLIKLDNAIEKVMRWKMFSETIDSYFYLYILKVLKAFEGFSEAKVDAQRLIEECSTKAKHLPNRTRIYEWFGEGNNLNSLISNKKLKLMQEQGLDERKWVKGKISDYTHPGKGELEVEGITVFFQPSLGNDGIGPRFTVDNIGDEVYFKFGFSYDGLIAVPRSVYSVDNFNKAKELWANREYPNDSQLSFNAELQVENPSHTDNKKEQEPLENGSIITGTVSNINKNFVFINISNGDKGSIHISKVSNKFISDLSREFVKGDTIKAKVIQYNDRYNSWDLSIKDLTINSDITQTNTTSISLAFDTAQKRNKKKNLK